MGQSDQLTTGHGELRLYCGSMVTWQYLAFNMPPALVNCYTFVLIRGRKTEEDAASDTIQASRV